MKRTILLLFLPFFTAAQMPAGYYDGTDLLTGYALKTKLHEIISTKNTVWNYDDLTSLYGQTDLDKYYDHDASNSTYLLDIYSEIPAGPDAYEYTTSNLIGSSNAEGNGWNREHMMPQSTFNSNYPMYSDLFFVVPTDAKINQLRSNYPYGVAKISSPFYTFTNGSTINSNATPGSAYTGRVYEPIDEFKGDIARSLLYFAVRYETKLSSFNFYNGTSPASDRSPLDGTEEKAFENWYIALLLKWHQQDPVSQREIDRNNTVYTIQKNRNPFIDHPEWVNLIWNQTPDAVAPQAPSNLNVVQTSAYFVNLNWSASNESDVIGYKIYQNGILVATSKKTNVIIDHLTPSTAYNFTVKAYDNGYLESADSNLVSVTTLASDLYSKDLYITKYLEGTGNNKAIEITNKTGHAVDLNKYRLSVQFYNSVAGNYYFPAPYELEGTVQHNETFVVLNPKSAFSCITNEQAKIVTAAPQMSFNGTNYLELRYSNSTVDALGTRGVSNSLADVSLYRSSTVSEPSSTYNAAEWTVYPTDYCENIGTLAASDINVAQGNNFSIYPNPVVSNTLFVKGNNLGNIQKAAVYDLSGKLIHEVVAPFKTSNSLSIPSLAPGVYLLNVDGQTIKFIKR